MTEKTRQKVIGVVMTISIIWAGANYGSDSEEVEPTEKAKTIQPMEAATKKPIQKNLPQNVIEEYSDISWGRSPFISTYSYTETGKSEFAPESIGWNLSGIIYNQSSPVAVINKRPVVIGQVVDQAEVMAIKKDEVIIKIDDKEIKLKVSKG